MANDLRAAFVDKLAQSGLDLADARKLQLSLHTAEESAEFKLPAVAGGFKIPYFTMSGTRSKFFRYRYLEDTRRGFAKFSKLKPLRYGQTADTVNEVYFAPNFGWKKWSAKNEPLIITEGEIKSATACKMGLPTIGLGGVWCFMSKRHNIPLLPEFEELGMKGREVFICYDSDGASNPDVIRAEAVLAKRLVDLGATVRLVRLPNVLGDDKKTGLDDFLVKRGVEAFLKLLGECEEYEASKELHALNEEVVYIRDPGIIYSYKHALEMRAADFTGHAFSNRWHYEKEQTAKGEKLVRKKTAVEWLSWPMRAELERMTYAPGQDLIIDNKLNTWRGWGVEPKKGDITLWKQLLDHVFFGEHPAVRKWFEQWCAFPMQLPGTKLHSSVLLWGVIEGSGKTTIGQTLMLIYGENASELKDADLDNPRNEWAEKKQFVLADDITGRDSRQHANRIKTMITQREMRIDRKYVPSYTLPDCINYFFTSNDSNAQFMDDGNRRNFVHEVRSGKLSEQFRQKFFAWRDNGGLAAIFDYLLHVDLEGFDPKADAMVTDSKREMIRIGKSDLGEWVFKLREDTDRILGAKLKGDLFTAEELLAVYDPDGTKRVSANAMSRELKRSFFMLVGGNYPLETAQGFKRAYAVRNREHWSTATRKQATDHYNEYHPVLDPKARKY